MQLNRAGRGGVLERHDARQAVIVNIGQFGRIGGLYSSIGHHQSYRLAYKKNRIGGQHRHAANNLRLTQDVLDSGRIDQRAEAGSSHIFGGEYTTHPRGLTNRRPVSLEAGVGMH